jgi:hypothetical protein
VCLGRLSPFLNNGLSGCLAQHPRPISERISTLRVPRCFQQLIGWYDTDVVGIDAGITMLMAENLRSNFVWNTFLKNAEVQNAFSAVGLR